MKTLKSKLRLWVTTLSLASFVGGWIMLAHAPKPASLIQDIASASLPTLEPLPPLSAFDPGSSGVQNQQLFNIQPRQRFGFNPFFRTGGS